jgi:DNA-binding transcriptional LysR family regulator
MESLRSLEIFLAVAETRSFAEAARRLGLSPSATGKAIAALETRLGVRLFNRTTRRVSLTSEGELLFGRARRLQDEWRETEALLSASIGEPQGWLRVSLPAVGYRFLAPHLSAFAKAYPKIRLDLDFDDRIKDVVAEGFDIAIRSGDLSDSSLLSCKLGTFRFVLCAAPSYISERGEPASLAELAEHRLIRFRYAGTEMLQDWRLANGEVGKVVQAMPSIVCTNMEGVCAAAIAGLGIAWSPDFLVSEALSSSRLVEVLSSEATEGHFSLLWPAGLHASPRLRVFLDFAKTRLFQPGFPRHAPSNKDQSEVYRPRSLQSGQPL